MTRQEIKVAVLTLGLIVLAALYLSQRRHVLGNPGLILQSQVLTNQDGVKVAEQAVALPTRVPGYQDELMPIAAHEIEVLPKDTTFGRRRYESGDKFSAQITAILMGSDRTSIHKPYYCITGQGWQIQKTEVIEIPMARPQPYVLRAQLVSATMEARTEKGKFPVSGLYIYWFVSENQLTPDQKEQMWLLARDLIKSGVLQRWGYISCFSYCAPGQEQIQLQRMKRLIAETVPAFQKPHGSRPKQTALLELGPQVN